MAEAVFKSPKGRLFKRVTDVAAKINFDTGITIVDTKVTYSIDGIEYEYEAFKNELRADGVELPKGA